MTQFIKLELAISREGLKINGVYYKANIQFDNNEGKRLSKSDNML